MYSEYVTQRKKIHHIKASVGKKKLKNKSFSWNFPSILQNTYSVSTETVNKEDSEMWTNRDISFASSKTKET